MTVDSGFPRERAARLLALAAALFFAASCGPSGGPQAPAAQQAAPAAPDGPRTIELLDLISAFVPDANSEGITNPQAWEFLAEHGSPVTWITDGIRWDDKAESYARDGTALVTIDGESIRVLRRELEPGPWSIRLTGPRGFVMRLSIGSPGNAAELDPDFPGYLVRRHVPFAVERCDGSGSATGGARLLRIELPGKQPAWVRHDWSCGSAGCAVGWTVHLFEPEGAELADLRSTRC